jgi:predicted O-methyltransferase YrrM
MPSVFLAIPILREVHALVLESILHTSGEHITNICVESGYTIPIDEKRNKCVEKFLATNCTHLLFWDSDTIAIPGAIQKLLDDDKDIVGATIYKKGGDHVPCFGFWVPERQIYKTPLPFLYNKLLPVDMVGTGFLLIKREVLEKMTPPYFQCYEKGNAQEDIFFCLKAKEFGFQPFVDTGLNLGHIATPYIVTNETYEMSTLWSVIKRFRDEGRLDKFRELLSKEMNLTPEELQLEGVPLFRLRMARDIIGYRPPEGLKDAYLEYIKEVSNQQWTISWELCVYLDKLLKSLKPKRILDLGSGFSSFIFRATGTEVTTVDTDSVWLEKTKKFLDKHKTNTDRMQLLGDFVPDGKYDLCLMDLGVAEWDRAAMLSKVRKYCKVIVLDDMHVGEYRGAVEREFADCVILDLKVDTSDAYNRYAWMVVTP